MSPKSKVQSPKSLEELRARGRLAFRSVDERTAFEIVHEQLPAMRKRLRGVNSLEVLNLAAAQLKTLDYSRALKRAKLRLIEDRFQQLWKAYPELRPQYSLMHEN